MARCFQLLNQLPDAAAQYVQFVKDHPDAAEVIEARFRLGEVQLAQNQPQEARRTWQDLLAAHPDSKSERIPEAAFKIFVDLRPAEPGQRRKPESRRGESRIVPEKLSWPQARGAGLFANRRKLPAPRAVTKAPWRR